MINIAEILKDCPKGTKLYSPICGKCRLLKIYDGLGLDVITDADDVFNFSYDGRFDLNGECCIFPSKENRDWNTFQKPFKDGDILTYTGNYTTTFIYRNKDNEPHLATSFYVGCNDAPYHNFLIYNKYTLIALNENCDVRLATEDEKIKLFNAIKTNGYKWNAETKTLEKLIIPKFKVGDIVKSNRNTLFDYKIIKITDTHYTLESIPGANTYDVLIYEDENWKLLPKKFDISTLKAYDKVLVRDSNKKEWFADLFSHILDRPLGGYAFGCVGHTSKQCIPYEGNEYLLGKCDDCDEYYKNW